MPIVTLDSLLGLVNVLTSSNPNKIAKAIRQVHQTIIAPDPKRDQTQKYFPQLHASLITYIQDGQKICQCRYKAGCKKNSIQKTIRAATVFKANYANITAKFLTKTEHNQYQVITKLIPEISRMPMACVNSQDPKIRITNYYPEPRLDFFLKELRINTENACSCNTNHACITKVRTARHKITSNIDVNKLKNYYVKGMYYAYDGLSKLCLETPTETNSIINIQKPLTIHQTKLKQPSLTLAQAREYIGFEVTVTRKNGRTQQGILLDLTDNVITLQAGIPGGKVNNFIPLNEIANLKATRPKEQI